MRTREVSRDRVEQLVLLLYDIEGYTGYCDFHTGRREFKFVIDLTRMVVNGCNSIITDFGGRPYNFTGDGYLSAFPQSHSEAALDAALAIQRLARELKRRGDFPKKDLYLRAALHKGECPLVKFDGSENYTPIGRTPSKLQRIEGCARPGEIFASEPVIAPVKGKYKLEKIIGLYLKGITHQNPIYKVHGKKG